LNSNIFSWNTAHPTMSNNWYGWNIAHLWLLLNVKWAVLQLRWI
jgi:hypothetical protein